MNTLTTTFTATQTNAIGSGIDVKEKVKDSGVLNSNNGGECT